MRFDPGLDTTTVWASFNQGEILPALVTPLTGSMLEREYRFAYLFGSLLLALGVRDVPDGPLIDILYHRPYFNLSRLSRIMRQLGVFPIPYLDLQVLATNVATGAPITWRSFLETFDLTRTSIRKLPFHIFVALRLLVRAVRLLPIGDQEGRRACKAYDVSLAAITPADVTQLSNVELLELLGRMQKDLPNIAGRANVPGVVVSGLVFLVLDGLLRRWLDDFKGIIGADITEAGVTHKMAELNRALWQLTQEARTLESVRSVLLDEDEQPSEVVLKQLEMTPEGQKFLARAHQFLDEYGHYGPGEIELSCARWREEPGFVLNVIRQQLHDSTVGQSLPDRWAQRQHEVQTKRQALAARLNPWQRALFVRLLQYFDRYVILRENSKFFGLKGIEVIRRVVVEAGYRLTAANMLSQPEDVFFLLLGELEQILVGQLDDVDGIQATIAARCLAYEQDAAMRPPPVVRSDEDVFNRQWASDAQPDHTPILQGIGVSPGRTTGEARLGIDPGQDFRLEAGHILVVPHPDPAWFLQMRRASAIVADAGGMLSHLASVARECGVPAVFGVKTATQLVHDGDLLIVDGDRGLVSFLPNQIQGTGA